MLMFPFIVVYEICALILLFGVKGGEAKVREVDL
jgi:hypothetical protein